MQHLKIYRAILAIQRSGSIRKAAEKLAISPSALNRSLQSFEEGIGLPIFDRVPGGVVLTAAGELLIPVMERHIIEFDDLRGQMRNLRDGVSGRVAISFGRDLDAGQLLHAVTAFEAAHPGVSVTLETDDDLTALKRRNVDLAVVTAPRTDDAVEVLYACDVALSAQCTNAPAGLDGIWDLMDRRLILPPPETGTRVALEHMMRRSRLTPTTVTTAAASQMAALRDAGQGICIAPITALGQAPRLDIALGTVQISILRATRVPMKKAAVALSLHLQAALEAHAS